MLQKENTRMHALLAAHHLIESLSLSKSSLPQSASPVSQTYRETQESDEMSGILTHLYNLVRRINSLES